MTAFTMLSSGTIHPSSGVVNHSACLVVRQAPQAAPTTRTGTDFDVVPVQSGTGKNCPTKPTLGQWSRSTALHRLSREASPVAEARGACPSQNAHCQAESLLFGLERWVVEILSRKPSTEACYCIWQVVRVIEKENSLAFRARVRGSGLGERLCFPDSTLIPPSREPPLLVPTSLSEQERLADNWLYSAYLHDVSSSVY